MPSARAVAIRVVALALAAAAAAWALTQFGAVYVGGDSMRPALRRGDLIVYSRAFGEPAAGDIVWVSKPGWPGGVIHRVEEVLLDERLVLRGDANPVPDLRPYDASAVRGVVVLVVPTGSIVSVVAWLGRMVQSHATERISMR